MTVQDRPGMSELLAAVQQFLSEEIVPSVTGRTQFHARVAANVVGMIRREIALAPEHDVREWQGLDRLLDIEARPDQASDFQAALRRRTQDLCARIQAGEADGGPWRTEVVQHVRQTVVDKLRIANPKYLGEEKTAEAAPTRR